MKGLINLRNKYHVLCDAMLDLLDYIILDLLILKIEMQKE